jgi:hypothetical protein
MKNFRCYLAIFIVSIMPSLSYACSCTEKQGFIYDAFDKTTDNTSWVFNFSTHLVSLQAKYDASIHENKSEIAGPLNNCGNDNYFCVNEPVKMVIPKIFGGVEWTYLGITCRRRSRSKAETYTIYCGYGNNLSTIIKYSLERGIISFNGSSKLYGVEYRIRGHCGMFAVK